MDRKALQKLVEQARKDPKFFHALVFDPKSVMKKIDYLDPRTKSTLAGINPEEVIATICGASSAGETSQDYAP